jgi:hypothetical protein
MTRFASTKRIGKGYGSDKKTVSQPDLFHQGMDS